MTFNVRGAHHRDGKNVWKRRAGLNVRTIKKYGPDLIGFQEFQGGNQKTYDRELPGYDYILGPEYENFPPRSRNAIYWNPERLELLDAGGFWLSEAPDEFSGSWGTHQVRSANWAKFRPDADGPEFIHLNTHLDHKSIQARRQGARLIVNRLEELADGKFPAIVTGDFNAEPGSPVYRTFIDAGFGDAHLLSENPPTRTFHKFQGDGFVPRRPDREGRLDWTLVRGGPSEIKCRKGSCRVVQDSGPPVFPSDHYPVIVDFSLQKTGSKAV